MKKRVKLRKVTNRTNIQRVNENLKATTRKMKQKQLGEGFRNIPEKTTTTINSVTAMAQEEHDRNEKEFKTALRQNKANAESTIPKHNFKGKRVTSPNLKKMHLSESAFDNDSNRKANFSRKRPLGRNFRRPTNESLKYKLARKTICEYNNGKLEEEFNPDSYVNRLERKRHITESQAKRLRNLIK